MKFLAAAITLLSSIGINAYQQCKLETEDLLQTGTVEFINDGSNQEQCFTVGLDFIVPTNGVQTAISTRNHDGNSGIDYSVRASRKDNDNAIYLSYLSGDNSWNKVDVSYLATSRSDVQAGSFIADTYSTFGCDQENPQNDIVRHAIPYFSGSEFNVATFISGARTRDGNADFRLSEPVFYNDSGVIEVKVTSDAKPSLQNLHISYVLWNSTRFNLKPFDPTSLAGDYQFYGPKSFTAGNGNVEALEITSDRLECQGTACSQSCLTVQLCNNLGGSIFNNRVCVLCGPYEKVENRVCVPNCQEHEVFENGVCNCEPGYTKLLDRCVWSCGINEIWNGACICDSEFARLAGVCRKCPEYSVYQDEKCVCNIDYLWNQDSLSCNLQCGQNQVALDNKSCICADGFVRFKQDCRACPEHATLKNGKCVCEVDYEWQDQGFLCSPLIPTCPPNSKWNQNKLQCECQRNGEYLINGLCRPCGPNEGWNQKQCVCVTGYFKINGFCRTCDPNTTYVGGNCVCNHGFYGNADKCEKCHSSCGQCSGPSAGQCITCSDVSYDLKDGYCSRSSPCPTGLYLDGQTCKPCSSYCDTCESESNCTTCIEGFKKETIKYLGTEASYCSEKCGDGRRYQVDCDDGNQRDGDGCSSKCEVEKGWHCQGGSSIKPSTCVSFKPDNTYITTTGTVHLFGRIVQGVRLSYIPPELTENECALCSKLLWVRVIDSRIVPGVRINYLPKSKYQFLAEFEFNGLFAIPVFSVSIQINPDYAKYFSESDMAQIEIKRIDPAVLNTAYKDIETLNLNDISGNNDQIILPDGALNEVFEE